MAEGSKPANLIPAFFTSGMPGSLSSPNAVASWPKGTSWGESRGMGVAEQIAAASSVGLGQVQAL